MQKMDFGICMSMPKMENKTSNGKRKHQMDFDDMLAYGQGDTL